MSFDISKPYRCKSGWKAVVIAAPNGRLYGYVGQRLRDVEYAEGCEWNSDGRCLDAGRSGLDLVNIPEKRTLDVWVNLHEMSAAPGALYAQAFATKSLADAEQIGGRIACLHIVREYEDGEGLAGKAVR